LHPEIFNINILEKMAEKKHTHSPEENVGEFISKTELFFEKHQKGVYYALLSVVLLVVFVLLAKNYYLKPRIIEASEKLVWCEQNLARDSFALALNGDGINEGYVEIFNNYSIIKAKNEAAAGAAVCSFHIGDYKQAIEYANKVNKKSFHFAPVMEGLKGDCYVELKDYSAAVSQFEKAASYKNDYIAPLYLKKAADIYMFEFKNAKKAAELYQRIKDEYFQSQQATDIDKYIERANIQ
jgi:tetratricopeptide (TPR) repeat protein